MVLRYRAGGALAAGTLALTVLSATGAAAPTAGAATAGSGRGQRAAVSDASAVKAARTVNAGVVRVQAGTTIQDSGLDTHVFNDGLATGFHAAYPQYSLDLIPVGTGQAITNAENGLADAVFTHSDASELAFVKGGYSAEAGGRLIMTSDFVTVGPTADPAGVSTGTPHDVVAAFKEIAAAGAAGKANFVARGDGSGTSTKELSIWKLTGIPTNAAGAPTNPSDPTQLASWYHVTQQGQGQNLTTTSQCPYAAGTCYTLSDRGTFNVLSSNSALPGLKVVSERNDGPTVTSASNLLANPYHAYAVNPDKVSGVNLAGAEAFLNYLTSAATQTAIGNYPSASAPAFVPDARPDVSVTSSLPKSLVAGSPLTVAGTLTARYPLDPALTGTTVEVVRDADPSTPVATTTVGADGTWAAAFRPTAKGAYSVFVPQSLDNLNVAPDGTFREPVTVAIGTLNATGSTSLAVTGKHTLTLSGRSVSVPVSGTALPQLGRHKATITVQIRKGNGRWVTASRPIPLHQDTGRYATKVALTSRGSWSLRSVYTDAGVVTTAYSRTATVLVR